MSVCFNMLMRMRTTIDIPDALLAKAKRLAQARHTTVRELTIEGLRAVLDRNRLDDPGFACVTPRSGKEGSSKASRTPIGIGSAALPMSSGAVDRVL